VFVCSAGLSVGHGWPLNNAAAAGLLLSAQALQAACVMILPLATIMPLPHTNCMKDDDMYEELERRALFSMPGDETAPDLVGSIRGVPDAADDALDLTMGGYVAKHDRVPAFEGADGQPYTVDIDVVEDDGDPDNAFVAFYIFIRWAATGAGIMDHVESGDIARAASEELVRAAAMDLSLYEIKAELDAAIARRTALED
jgi:hypothetical protein